ncbi:MAG TPA: hypothetical protein VF490_21315 [Chryseosolibacter sp.]
MEFLKGGERQQRLSRRIFFSTLSVAVAGVMLVRKLTWKRKPRQAFATFLTEDGKLVQAPLDRLSGTRAPATNEQLVSWIWKDRKL